MKPVASAEQRPTATVFDQALAAIERINQRRQTTVPDFFKTVGELVIMNKKGARSIFTGFSV